MSSQIDILFVKIAYAPPSLPPRPTAIRQLLEAKRYSDIKQYPGKHHILRSMIIAEPDSFEIDSENNGIVGLTHRTGFRIHIPKTALPPVKLNRRLQRSEVDEQ